MTTARTDGAATDESQLACARRRRWRQWCIAGAVASSALCWLARAHGSPEALLAALLFGAYGAAAIVFRLGEWHAHRRSPPAASEREPLRELVDADDRRLRPPAWLLSSTAALGIAPCLAALRPALSTSTAMRIATAAWSVALLAVSSMLLARFAYLILVPRDRAHARFGGTSRRR